MHLIAVSQHHNPTCIIWGCVTQNLKQKLKPEYISICRLRSSSLMFLLPFGKEKYILYNFQIHREKRFVFFFIYFLQNNNNNIQKPVTKDFFSSFWFLQIWLFYIWNWMKRKKWREKKKQNALSTGKLIYLEWTIHPPQQQPNQWEEAVSTHMFILYYTIIYHRSLYIRFLV